MNLDTGVVKLNGLFTLYSVTIILIQ